MIKSMSVMSAEHSSLPSIGTIGRLFVGSFAGFVHSLVSRLLMLALMAAVRPTQR